LLVTVLKSWLLYYINIWKIYFFFYLVTNLNGSSVIIDLLTRANLNDSFISLYYLLWTFINYIPIFFFILILFLYYKMYINLNKFLIYINIISWLIFIYLIELNDGFASNFNSTIITVTDTNINILLVNILNRYHPYVFYVCTALLSSYLLLYYFLKSKPTDYVNFNELQLYKKHITSSVLNTGFIFLYLGSWWACQEGSWGGWWNSDSSEMLGLLLWVIALISTHQILTLASNTNWNLTIYIIFNAFLFLYYFLQMNYELTSHNFGARFFFFFNNNLFYVFALLSICICLSQILKQYYVVCTIWTFSFKNITVRLQKFYINLISILIICFYIWLSMSIVSLINLTGSIEKHDLETILRSVYLTTQILFLLYMLILFFKIRIEWLCITLILTFYNYTVFILLLLQFIRWQWFWNFFHWLIILFIAVIIGTNDLLFSYYSNATVSTNWVTFEQCYSNLIVIYSCENNWYDHTVIVSDTKMNLFNSWTTTTFLNSIDADRFNLFYNNTVIVNYFYFIFDYLNVFMVIEFNETQTLNILVILGWLVCCQKFLNKFKM